MTCRAILATVLLTALASALSAAPGTAQPAASAGAPPVEAQAAWARATPPGASTGAVYVTLTAPAGDRLTGASSPLAGKTALHDMKMEGNVMRMDAVPSGLELPPGKPVALAPGGYHLMLEGLKQPLKQGESIPLHLTFAKAPPLDIMAEVQAIGAAGPAAAGSMDHAAMPGMMMKK